jgi:hypothetical protein
MKPVRYGAIVFGASALLFGVIALMWHDADTWQSMANIWKWPFGSVIGGILMVAQIAGGIGLPFPRTARSAAILLGVVYVFFSLACIPDILAAPATYLPYGNFFYQVSLVCGALAAYAATEKDAPQAAALGRLARLGLGLCTGSFALSQIFYLQLTAGLVPKWIPPGQMFWTVLTTIAFALAAIAILINRQARLALRLMTVMLVLFGVLIWVPALIAHPEAHFNWSEFAENFLAAGAVWLVADLRSTS